MEASRHGAGGNDSWALSPVQESGEIDNFAFRPHSYRESIRKISFSGGLRRSTFFLPSTADSGGGTSWSTASSASSRSSFSVDDHFSAGRWETAVHELRSVAGQMVREGYARRLIQAFGESGACISGGAARPDEQGLERWFSELDVDWVLRTTEEGGIVQVDLGHLEVEELMERWIRALLIMMEVLSITQSELRDKKPATAGKSDEMVRFFLQLKIITGMVEREHKKFEQEVLQLVRFAEATVLRMFAFIDTVAVVASNPETLPGMLQVYGCFSKASPAFLAFFKEASDMLPTSGSIVESKASAISTVFDAMKGVIKSKRKKMNHAIWSMMEKVRSSILVDECRRVTLPEAVAGGVHKTTALMANYIALLWRYEATLTFLLQDHDFVSVPDTHGFSSVANLVAHLISCLQEQILNSSKSISDPGPRCLFLMNNLHFVSQCVERLGLPSSPVFDERFDEGKQVQSHLNTYLEVSWMPLMSCLSLSKFESGFQRTYTSQKFWKVPDPELRHTLRKAIIRIVVPGYRDYLLGASVGNKARSPGPKYTTQLLEEVLEEIFEG